MSTLQTPIGRIGDDTANYTVLMSWPVDSTHAAILSYNENSRDQTLHLVGADGTLDTGTLFAAGAGMNSTSVADLDANSIVFAAKMPGDTDYSLHHVAYSTSAPIVVSSAQMPTTIVNPIYSVARVDASTVLVLVSGQAASGSLSTISQIRAEVRIASWNGSALTVGAAVTLSGPYVAVSSLRDGYTALHRVWDAPAGVSTSVKAQNAFDVYAVNTAANTISLVGATVSYELPYSGNTPQPAGTSGYFALHWPAVDQDGFAASTASGSLMILMENDVIDSAHDHIYGQVFTCDTTGTVTIAGRTQLDRVAVGSPDKNYWPYQAVRTLGETFVVSYVEGDPTLYGGTVTPLPTGAPFSEPDLGGAVAILVITGTTTLTIDRAEAPVIAEVWDSHQYPLLGSDSVLGYVGQYWEPVYGYYGHVATATYGSTWPHLTGALRARRRVFIAR